MENSVQAVTFSNRTGETLFGTLHLPPESNSTRPIIVLLSPGVKMRVGPHRLYNRMTESFNKLGFSVFKFDFTGLGDSEGELNRKLLAEVYNDTETGSFVDDSLDALNWLEKEYGHQSFILAGLCGGAITGLLTAKEDKRVIGLLSLGMTVTLAMGWGDRTKFASQGELASLRKGYFRRMLNPKSWLRLLTFQSDFSTIIRSLGPLFFRKKKSLPAAVGDKEKQSNANPLFPPAFFEMTRNQGKVLLIFSQSDRLLWDFEEKFAQPYASELAEVRDSYECHVVDDANHVFSFREWEQEMLDVSRTWLHTHFNPSP